MNRRTVSLFLVFALTLPLFAVMTACAATEDGAAAQDSLILDGEGWAGADKMAREFDGKIAEFRKEYGNNAFLWMQFTADSKVMTVDGKKYNLSAAPKMEGEELLLPADAIEKTLSKKSIFRQLNLKQYDSEYITLFNMVESLEKLHIGANIWSWSEEDGFIILNWDTQPYLVLAMTKDKLNTKLLGARDAAYDGNGIWVLQFDAYDDAFDAWDTLEIAGINTHVNAYPPVGPGDPVPSEPIVFADVDPSSWYAEYVNYVIGAEIFRDTGDYFEPDTLMTRAMTVVALCNFSYGKRVKTEIVFSDVKFDDWFSYAVDWASANGIVTGGNGVFRPNDAVTRQELVTFLYRYAKYKGYDVSAASDLSDWSDVASVSEYARDAMAWAVESGIIEGKNGKLAPRDVSTRAEAAAIIARYGMKIENTLVDTTHYY